MTMPPTESSPESNTPLPSVYATANHGDSPHADTELRNGLIDRSNGNGSLALAAEDEFNESSNNPDSSADGVEDEALDPIQLPQSTHSLLFSEPVFSLPFIFAVVIMALSFLCLWLALLDNQIDEVPVNVEPQVKVAQYISIVIAILMEEEIPTGLYLLRMIPKLSLHQKFPRMKYYRFVFSSIIRILNGYYFLINVMIVLIKSTGVLEIFYDVLALQFVQQLDDIAFALAKMDVFGKRLQRACTAKCFRVEFSQNRMGRNKNISRLLKGLTAFNFVLMLAYMSAVTVRQMAGKLYPESISVKFGSTIWDTAWAKNYHSLENSTWDENSTEYEKQTLIYSFFNGVYIKQKKLKNGRPVYLEARKFDDTPYERTVPASFQYCLEISAWVFMHEDIKKREDIKKSNSPSKSGCQDNWLLRSPETVEFDILSVTSDWQAWVGVIEKSDISIASNECKDETDCNLNGVCEKKKCVCHEYDDVKYLGTHCEVIIPNSCKTIISGTNSIWQTIFYNSTLGSELAIYYSRPAYGIVSNQNISGTTVYLGDRWYSSIVPIDPEYNVTAEDTASYDTYISEAHAFWYKSLANQYIRLVSDPTASSTPVGVDFYQIVDRGEQYGPLGARDPYPNDTIGRGLFRCGDIGNITNINNSVAGVRKLLQYPKVIDG